MKTAERDVAADKRTMVRQMFAQIAPTYDLLNTVLSANVHRGWRRAALDAACLTDGCCLLDLATGTADVALAAARRGVRVVGADFCAPLLRIGQTKIRQQAPGRICLTLGEADHLPFADGSFDAVVMAFALRNVPSPEHALSEMRRVTRRGGWVVNLELTRPQNTSLAHMYRLYQNHVMPFVGWLVSGNREAYTYLPRTIQDFDSPAQVAEHCRRAGLEQVSWQPLSGGLATLHRGQRP